VNPIPKLRWLPWVPRSVRKTSGDQTIGRNPDLILTYLLKEASLLLVWPSLNAGSDWMKFRTAETWGCPGPVRKYPGNVCSGMFSRDPEEDPTVEESSTFYEENRTTSTSLQKLSMFITGLPSIIFGLSRRIISFHLLERSTGGSTFYRPRWKHIYLSSTRYGLRLDVRLSGR